MKVKTLRLPTEDFPFDKITSVAFSKGMATGDLKVMAMGSESKFNVNKDDGKEITDLIREPNLGCAAGGCRA